MPTRKQLEEADRLINQFDWAKYDAMTDEEIQAHWSFDPDMAWPSEEELAEFDLVVPAKSRRNPPEQAAE